MNLAVLALGLFLIALLLVGFGVWGLVTKKSPLQRASQRAIALQPTSLDLSETALRRARETGETAGFSPLGMLRRRLGEAGVAMPAERFALYMGGATILIGALFPLLGGVAGLLNSAAAYMIVGLFALAIGVVAPLAWISRIAAKRSAKFEAQFPSGLDIFVRGLRAGHPVSSALELLVSEMPDPISQEFGLVRAEMNYGADLRSALTNLTHRVNTPDVNMFVVSVAIQSETGGNLADILEGLARVIRERASMVLKVRALSSEGRMSAVVLSILPAGTFGFIFATQPKIYLDVADDPIFLPALFVLALLYVSGMIIINRMVRITV